MNQKDYNSMMMSPEEGHALRHPKLPVWNKCPMCGENYSGDGISLCVECEASLRHHWQGGREMIPNPHPIIAIVSLWLSLILMLLYLASDYRKKK